jgi:hypothetical protein
MSIDLSNGKPRTLQWKHANSPRCSQDCGADVSASRALRRFKRHADCLSGKKEIRMAIHDPGDFSGQFTTAMPEPVIPVRRMPPFMKALWLLALMVLVGIGYSFWRISSVATPKLDLPGGAQPANPQSP